MPLYDLVIQFRFRYIKNLGNSIVDFFSQVKGLFSTFRAIDFIDILFVAVILFLVIRVIRETRAMQLIKGLLFLVLVYFLVTFFGMVASSYILRMIFTNILLILVILFSPEIRNILEQMGKGTTRKAFKSIFNSLLSSLKTILFWVILFPPVRLSTVNVRENFYVIYFTPNLRFMTEQWLSGATAFMPQAVYCRLQRIIIPCLPLSVPDTEPLSAFPSRATLLLLLSVRKRVLSAMP